MMTELLAKQLSLIRRKRALENLLNNHDCHLGPEDGCNCGEAKTKLAVISRDLNNLNQVIWAL